MLKLFHDLNLSHNRLALSSIIEFIFRVDLECNFLFCRFLCGKLNCRISTAAKSSHHYIVIKLVRLVLFWRGICGVSNLQINSWWPVDSTLSLKFLIIYNCFAILNHRRRERDTHLLLSLKSPCLTINVISKRVFSSDDFNRASFS